MTLSGGCFNKVTLAAPLRVDSKEDEELKEGDQSGGGWDYPDVR